MPLLAGDPLDDPLAQVPLDRVLRQEDHPHAVLPRGRQGDVQLLAHPPQERVRRAHQDAGPVAAVLLAPARPPVVHVLQHLQRVTHDLMAGLALDVADEADAAGVLLEPRVVQALGLGQSLGATLARGVRKSVMAGDPIRLSQAGSARRMVPPPSRDRRGATS